MLAEILMLTKERITGILEEQYPYLASEYGIKKIGLFGSYAKDKQTEKSDIDIILDFDKPIGLKFIELIDYLEEILGKKVDVLTADGVKGIIVKRIAEDIEKSIIYV